MTHGDILIVQDMPLNVPGISVWSVMTAGKSRDLLGTIRDNDIVMVIKRETGSTAVQVITKFGLSYVRLNMLDNFTSVI